MLNRTCCGDDLESRKPFLEQTDAGPMVIVAVSDVESAESFGLSVRDFWTKLCFDPFRELLVLGDGDGSVDEYSLLLADD
jgi:hypothetical protein